jgi:hypothetical protein
MRTQHEEQLKVITLLVQRELIRSGIIAGPRNHAWTLDDAYPLPPIPKPPGTFPLRVPAVLTALSADEEPQPGRLTTKNSRRSAPDDDGLTATRELIGRPAAVLTAALMVQAAFVMSTSELQQAREIMRQYAEAAEAVARLLDNNTPALLEALRTFSLSDWVATYGSDTDPLNYAELVGIVRNVGDGANDRACGARRFVDVVTERALAQNAVYERQEQGRYMHFLALLDSMGLTVPEITDVLDELPRRKAGSTTQRKSRDRAAAPAIDAVGKRVRRARATLLLGQGTSSAATRVPTAQRMLVLLCRYVSPGERVLIDIRSGDDVPDSGRERSPLDPLGPPTQRAPRSAPADPPRGPGAVPKGRKRPHDGDPIAPSRTSRSRTSGQPRSRGRTGTKSPRKRS